MLDIGYLAAFLGGVLALLSPCSALLLPSFFAYAFQSSRALLLRTVALFVGLCAVLVPLGTGASAVSTLFYGHRDILIQCAGWTIIGLGTVQLLGGGFGSRRAAGLQQRFVASGSWLSTLGLGAAYGLAGFCSGPILGSVLTVAATSGQPLRGAMLLAVYAFGMTAPMFVLALLWRRFDLVHRRWLRGRPLRLGRLRLHTTSLLSGLLFIAIGVVFLRFDGTAGITGVFGDTTDIEYSLQQQIETFAAHVPGWLIPVAAGTVVAAVVVRRVLKELRAPQSVGTSSLERASTPSDPDRPSRPKDDLASSNEQVGAPR